MSRAQRFTFLGIAVVIAVIAAILIVGGDEGTNEDVRTSATATATATSAPQEASPQETETPTPTPTATPTPKPPPLLQAGKVTRLEFTEGETVRFRVRSDEDEEVHVHGYDISKDVGAGETVTMSFKAATQGIFEIEFEISHEQIGELRVQPD